MIARPSAGASARSHNRRHIGAAGLTVYNPYNPINSVTPWLRPAV
jgi:hypothetical protein